MSNTSALLTLAQVAALPREQAIAYLDARIAKGFKNDAKAANWTRAREDIRAGKTPDTKPQIAKIVEAAKAAPKAPAKPKAPKAAPAPVAQKPKAVAFTRTNERVDVLTKRVDNVEAALLAIASTQASMKEALDILVKRAVA